MASLAIAHPRNVISRVEIQDAARRISRHIRRTPVIALEDGAFGVNARIFLKLEGLQHSGSFKARGAFNCLLSSQVAAAGVIAASGGNHGAAVAYAAQQLGCRAEIFVPTISSPNKIERMRQYEAVVNVGGRDYAEAFAASRTAPRRPAHWKFTPMMMRVCSPARERWGWNLKSRCAGLKAF